MPDAHLEADFPPPEYTTPQGTQEHGVAHGYEERDVNFRALVNWFGGLLVFVVISIILIGITNELYNRQVRQQEEQEYASQPLLLQRQIPPKPWLIPNPVDTKVRQVDRHEVLMGPWDEYADHREQEDKALREARLETEEGIPVLPHSAVQAVIAENGAGLARPEPHTIGAGAAGTVDPNGVRAEMPSDSSGGTAVENQIR